MFTRLARKKKPRGSALAISAIALVAAVALFAAVVAALVSDTGTIDITVANKNHSAGPFDTTNGASVEYIGSSAQNQASGTGLFDPFVRLQGTGSEQGYNTNGAVQFDTKSGSWTHAIPVNAIPQVPCHSDATKMCWELFNDINESNTAKRISLNIVEIWFTDDPNLVGYTPGTGFASGTATKEYEFDGDILINDVNQGSGRGDLRMLVPTAGHTWNASTWFVLYSKWGTTPSSVQGTNGTGAWTSDGGFEEWKVRKSPNLSITKTADALSVNAGSNIGFTVTITNNGPADATGVQISDSLPGGTGAQPVTWAENPDNANCSIAGSAGSQSLSCGPVTLAANGGSLSVHVRASTTADNCGEYDNTATFTSTNAGTGFATATTNVTCGALVIKKESTKTGNPLVSAAGAVFSITGPNSYSASVTDNGTGDEDSTVGQVCVSGLAPGSYTVNETSPPAGYGGASQTDVGVTVSNGSDCGTNEPTSTAAVFTNAPLSDIQVNFRDGGSGETSATINCVDSSNNDIGSNDSTPTTGWDTSETDTGLPPDTYTCTITVDP